METNRLIENTGHVTIVLPLSERLLVSLGLAAFLIVLTYLVWRATKPKESKEVTDHLLPHQALILPGLLWVALVTVLLGAMLWTIWGIPEHLARSQLPGAAGNATTYFFGLTALTAVLAAVIALPFTVLRTVYAQRQTDVAEQGHITDQINKAVENLGAMRDVRDGDEITTQPNIEVRIGGLLALERISKTNPADHIQIMEILCAYIRENARAQVAADVELDENGVPKGDVVTLRDDIQLACKLVRRRSPELRKIEAQHNFRMSFENADFRGLDLSFVDFGGANLGECKFVKSDLMFADLIGTGSASDFRGANLSYAKLQAANLMDCRFEGANCAHIGMSERTELHNCRFDGACLSHVTIPLDRPDIHGFWYSFGDETVKIPNNGPRPPGWDREYLAQARNIENSQFHQAWHAWQDKIGFDRTTFTLKPPQE